MRSKDKARELQEKLSRLCNEGRQAMRMIFDGIDTLARLEHEEEHRKEQSKDAKLAIGIYLNEWTNGGLDP